MFSRLSPFLFLLSLSPCVQTMMPPTSRESLFNTHLRREGSLSFKCLSIQLSQKEEWPLRCCFAHLNSSSRIQQYYFVLITITTRIIIIIIFSELFQKMWGNYNQIDDGKPIRDSFLCFSCI